MEEEERPVRNTRALSGAIPLPGLHVIPKGPKRPSNLPPPPPPPSVPPPPELLAAHQLQQQQQQNSSSYAAVTPAAWVKPKPPPPPREPPTQKNIDEQQQIKRQSQTAFVYSSSSPSQERRESLWEGTPRKERNFNLSGNIGLLSPTSYGPATAPDHDDHPVLTPAFEFDDQHLNFLPPTSTESSIDSYLMRRASDAVSESSAPSSSTPASRSRRMSLLYQGVEVSASSSEDPSSDSFSQQPPLVNSHTFAITQLPSAAATRESRGGSQGWIGGLYSDEDYEHDPRLAYVTGGHVLTFTGLSPAIAAVIDEPQQPQPDNYFKSPAYIPPSEEDVSAALTASRPPPDRERRSSVRESVLPVARRRSSTTTLAAYLEVASADDSGGGGGGGAGQGGAQPATSGSTAVLANALKLTLYAKEKDLTRLQSRVKELRLENAEAIQALLSMVYKLRGAPAGGEEKSKAAMPLRRAKSAERERASRLEALPRAVSVTRTRRGSGTNVGGDELVGREWSSMAATNGEARGRSPGKGMMLNESLRKDALSEGQRLYEEEWGASGKYGKSMFLVESMKKAREAVENEREERKLNEQMNSAKIHREKSRDRSESYFHAVSPAKHDRKVVEAEREMQKLGNQRLAFNQQQQQHQQRQKSIQFEAGTKERDAKIAVKTDEFEEFQRWKQMQQLQKEL